MKGTPPGSRQSHPDNPSGTGLVEEYRKRCLRQTGSLDPVTPFFDETVELGLSRPHRFKLVLASKKSQVRVPGLQSHAKVRLACTVRARLVTSPEVLDVSPATWVSQRYLPPAPSSWTWVVTARSYGTSEAVLQLRPVMRISDDSGKVLTQDWTTQEYDVTFIVKRPPAPDKPLAAVIRDFLTASWKALVGMAVGVTAIAGAVVAVRGLMRKKSAAGPAASAATEHPPAQDENRPEDV